MPAIANVGVRAIQLPHAPGEIGLWGFEQEMIVVVHQAVGVAAPAEAVDHVGKPFQEQCAISIIEHDGLSGIAATRNMINGAGIFQSERTSHSRRR